MIAGLGSGKTYAGAVRMLVESRPGTLGLVVAPTYGMLRDATVRTFLEVAGPAVPQDGFNKSEMKATLVNGAEILFRSADNPEHLRGANIDGAWIDEASLCPMGTWEIVIGRLRAHGKANPCWVTTTPKGRNWLYERQSEMAIFRAATKDNPYLDPEFVRSLEASYTGAFARQELYGEFVSFEGLVYEEFDRGLHVYEHPGPFARYIAGVDEGYTNPAVILVLGVDNDGRMHLVEEFYKRRVLQGDFVGEARRLYKTYNVEAFYCDPSAAGLIAEMRSVHLPVVAADNDVAQGIQAVKARLAMQNDGRTRLTVGPGCVNICAEFESYAWKQGRDGMKDEPEKTNDHAMDALRYPIYALDKRRDFGKPGAVKYA